MKAVLKRSLLYWIPLTVIGMLNGALRVMVLTPIAGEITARQIASVMMAIWILIYSRGIFPVLHLNKQSEAILTGTSWVILTIAFEFALGVIGRVPLQTMLADYDLLAGRLWMVVILTLFISPIALFNNESEEKILHM